MEITDTQNDDDVIFFFLFFFGSRFLDRFIIYFIEHRSTAAPQHRQPPTSASYTVAVALLPPCNVWLEIWERRNTGRSVCYTA